MGSQARAKSAKSTGLAGAGLALAMLLSSSAALADGPWEGPWREGATRIDVQITSWGGDCGRRPESTSGAGGGTVQITQEGDHLVFHGRRTTRTNACWSENRAVRRVSSTFQSGTWTTTCRTPQEDSRGETGTYTLRAQGDSRLDFRDVSAYDWQLNASRCQATITTTQSFTRVGGVTPTPPTPPTPTPPTPQPTCTAGAPARLSLRPSQTTVEPGGRICLSARVVDAAGCQVRNASVSWELRRAASLVGDLRDGCFKAGDTAAEAEGTFTIVATSGSLRDEARVDVRTVDLSDLIARRGEGLGGGAPVTSSNARAEGSSSARVAASDVRAPRRTAAWIWPLAIGVPLLLLLLLLVIVIVVRRGRARRALLDEDSMDRRPARPRAGGAAQLHAGAPPPPPPDAASSRRPVASAGGGPSVPRACPTCHNEFEGVEFCPQDGAGLLPPGTTAPGPAQGHICPTCRRGYPPDAKFCPHDADELIPYSMFAARHRAAVTGEGERTKICPHCGDRYARDIAFCGKDGTELVLVN